MPELIKSVVYRGGLSASYKTEETREIYFRIDASKRCLILSFGIASAGGGTTWVDLQIDFEDLARILSEVAISFPESFNFLIAAAANRRNVELLEEARKVQSDDKERISTLIKQLGPVIDFISEKYDAAEHGNDERESALFHSVSVVIDELSDLTWRD
jgi:hypothetical protein